MTFPTEADIEFFTSEEAKRIQELWEPRAGDWATSKDGKAIFLLLGVKEEKKVKVARIYASASQDTWDLRVSNFAWLPRQGQLQAMLVEKGYTVCLTGPYMFPKNYQVILAREDDETEVEYGPTPSIALGRALIEVMGEV